jgi:hypothetical protein
MVAALINGKLHCLLCSTVAKLVILWVETMGLLVYRKMGWAKGEGSATPAPTARMDISLRGRVLTPRVCLVRAWADEVEAKNQGRSGPLPGM